MDQKSGLFTQRWFLMALLKSSEHWAYKKKVSCEKYSVHKRKKIGLKGGGVTWLLLRLLLYSPNYHRIMVDFMLMNIHDFRLFLSAVTPAAVSQTAVILLD